MYDEPFDWQDYMRRQDRTLSAAGGVPPTMETQPPQGGDLEDPMPQQPAQRTQPTNMQYTLEDRLGIKTHGPAADQQNEAIEQFDQGEQGFEGATKQGRPMQYGMDEPLGMSPGPLTPDRAAAKFMAMNPSAHRRQEGEQGDVLGLNIRQHSLGSADRAAKNQAYEAKVQADRERRAQEREAARNRPSAVEARSRLSSDVDRVRGLMEGPSQPGGPFGVQNAGGAILIGPGFGRRDDYRSGYNRNYDPQLELKIAQRERERQSRDSSGAARNDTAQRGLDIRAEGQKLAQGRFDTSMLFKKGNSAQEQRKELDDLIADFRRRSDVFQEGGDPDLSRERTDSQGKIVPGQRYQGSYNAIQRRILEIVRSLNDLHEQGAYDFQVDPDVARWIRNIRAARGADEMKNPAP